MFWFHKRPRKGEKYKVVTAFSAVVRTIWKPPCIGGYEKTVPVGLRFVIDQDSEAGSIAAIARPEPYEEWEKIFVEVKDREDPKYNKFYLVIPLKRLRKNCKQLASSLV